MISSSYIKKPKNQENKNKQNPVEFKEKEESRKNKHLLMNNIREQKEQERNRSKKTKKVFENKSKNKDRNKINSQKINSNQKINTNKLSNNSNNSNSNINEIENYLKNKTKISLGTKNFLGSSINTCLINEFEFKKSNLNPKTEKVKFINKSNKFSHNYKLENIGKEKEDKINLNLNNILIPMLNLKKENNCFLNVLIQVLFNLESFRTTILNYFNNNSLTIKDEVVFEFCHLINSYNLEQIKNEKNEAQIEPVLSVNLLRKKLNLKFGNYFKGECGDPMESLEHIFNSIHEYMKNLIQKMKIFFQKIKKI